jgi:hypothetical protein
MSKKSRTHSHKQKEAPEKSDKPRRLINQLTLEVLVGSIGVVIALIVWRQTNPLGWDRFWSGLTGTEIYADEESRFFFHNYKHWWSKGTVSPPNYLFQSTDASNTDVGLGVVILNEVHEYVISTNSDTRYLPDADLEYFILHLPDSSTRTWWMPGASVYLVLQTTPEMKINQHGMDIALNQFFSEKGSYELLNKGHTSDLPMEMKNSGLQSVSVYELRRIRRKEDVSVQIPRFRAAYTGKQQLENLTGPLAPSPPLPMISDGNDREGSELRICMIMFYRQKTFFGLTLYADPSVYDEALAEVLKPIFESWTFY